VRANNSSLRRIPEVALRALAEVNLAAIERNAELLRTRIGPQTSLCAVVKADGYGHGAEYAARAALRGGATTLAVATALEAGELRSAGLDVPILVLGAVSDDELPVVVGARADVAVWDQRFVEQLDVIRAVLRAGPTLQFMAVMTHFATSDSDQEFVAQQLQAFGPFVAEARALADRELTVHAANSAATLLTPASHFDMVRAGIALYGCDPMNLEPADHGLEPALTLRSYVAAIKPIAPGESTGYGRRFVAAQDSHIATLPIGYADGIPRALANNCDVLIGGRRYPLRGMVSMDNITVDVGPHPTVAVGDRATLIGIDGDERQTAEDLARRIGTISYEVLCWISRRVPRVYHRDGGPV
jgi:alanine racemase